MRVWHILRSRLRSLFFRDRRESDLTEELQLHLERETERLQASGLSPEAARLQALRTVRRRRANQGGLSRRARHRLRRRHGPGHLLRTAHVQARSSRRLHHRVHGGARARPGRRGVHDAQRAAVSRRCGAGRARDVRGRAAREPPTASASVSRARNSTRSVARPTSSPTPTRSCPMSTAASTGA